MTATLDGFVSRVVRNVVVFVTLEQILCTELVALLEQTLEHEGRTEYWHFNFEAMENVRCKRRSIHSASLAE